MRWLTQKRYQSAAAPAMVAHFKLVSLLMPVAAVGKQQKQCFHGSLSEMYLYQNVSESTVALAGRAAWLLLLLLTNDGANNFFTHCRHLSAKVR